jgi:Domain of unknown function (DUF3854)
MSDFNEKQLQDLLASGIDRDLADIEISALDGDLALDAIFYALPLEERKNDGRVSDKWLRKYEHIRQHGGLAFYGINPIDGSRTDCISFKPNKPLSPDRKYEQPPHSQNQAFYPGVTDRIWQLVADRFGVPMSDNKFENFWQWVSANNLPVIVTEGCKKALSAISQGFPCVALTGIWNGVTANRNENGKTESYDLILSLKYLFGRKIYIAFDRDKAAATIKNVIQARSVLANKLIEIGCECYSIRWDSDEAKGLDDLIVNSGVEALEKSITGAEELTGDTPNFKKPMAASILAEKIAKEWKGRIDYYLPTKLWRVYRKGIWETLENDQMESVIYDRIIEDAPLLNSFNYVLTILKMVRGSLLVEK